MVPVAESWCICIDVIVAMVDPAKRPGGVVSSGGRSIVMHGSHLPARNETWAGTLPVITGIILFLR